MRAGGLADHIINAPSEYVPRITRFECSLADPCHPERSEGSAVRERPDRSG
jgi:hypothetical protein